MEGNKKEKFSLMIVDDDPLVVNSVRRIFGKDHGRYRIYSAEDGIEALNSMQRKQVDLALIDLNMPRMDGLTLLKKIKKDFPAVIVIVLTGWGGVPEAVKALKLGAKNFFEKPFSPTKLYEEVQQVYDIWQLNQATDLMDVKLGKLFNYPPLIGDSPAMLELKHFISRISQAEISVLIQGESGTGKELVARAIHYHSPRSEKPFVAVDCASLTETVIESELFGHIKGAYTGAHIDTQGLIRSAEKGTLFLDEVGELPLPMQAKLLRTIQQREVRPVGSTRSFKVDIRILAATNRDLAAEVRAGNFREDLFFRLNAILLEVPPLRKRKEDIPAFLRFFYKKFHPSPTSLFKISFEASKCLESYKWPGNVRELENLVLRTMALNPNKKIEVSDLPRSITGTAGDENFNTDMVVGNSLKCYEKAAIINALKKSQKNRRLAAKILVIGEATLYRKLKYYQIE